MATLTTLTNGTTADADVVMANFNAINNDYANQVGYSAYMGLQEGVFAGGDLMVTQRGAGANMSVDVAGGQAMVQDDASTQGLLVTIYKAALTNVSISAANATNPRVDQVVMSKAGTISVVAGTATSGATLDNRTGAAALPVSSVRLADILVPAASSSVSNSSIRDRRPDARGAHYSYTRTAGHIALSGTSYQDLSASDSLLGPRIENSGVPLTVTASGTLQAPGTLVEATLAVFQDGAQVTATERLTSIPASQYQAFSHDWTITPTAGSHVYKVYAKMTTTAGWVFANTNQSLTVRVEETVRQNARRNTTTSG